MDWSIVRQAMGTQEPRDWWREPDVAIPTGRVDVWGGSRSFALIRVHFDVPGVEPGTYSLMLCSAGCVEPLGDILPSRVTVAADPVAARTAREVGLLTMQGRYLQNRVGRIQRQIRAMRSADQEMLPMMDGLTTRADEQARRIRELEARVEELEGAAPAPAWLVVGAAGAALLLLLPRRRRPRRPPPEPLVEMKLEALPDPLDDLEPIGERAPVPAADAQPAARPLTPVRARAAAPHRAATARAVSGASPFASP
ncbi:MAG TPA: hypothetical protein VF097_02080 [Actinomycetota bacterium]